MERNKVSKLIGIKKVKGEKSENLHKKVIDIKDKISFLQDNSNSLNADLNKLIEVIPNIPEDDVPEGISEEDNVNKRKHGNNRIPYRKLPECIESKPAHKIVKDKVALFGGNHRHSLFFNHPDKNLIPDSFT